MSKINKRKYFLTISIVLITLLLLVSIPACAHAAQTKKIVIDPGHGGIDSGCTIKNIYEKNINLDISMKVKSYLEQNGFNVVLTRNGDESLYKYCKTGDTIEKRDLNARVNKINESNASIFVSIHADSYYDHTINGSIVYFFSEQCLQSKALAKSIQRSLNGLTADGKKRMSHNSRAEDYYILRNTSIPGVLVETGFLTNPRERSLLATDEFRQKIANSIASGITQYMKN
ncbi:N-acetylmuramoyl-L-alanine amidase family protein [Pseudobacteroides cellulosolvens]|uniref:Cell wall hydrolase/autolysin n=1 Tax=Pseudobacteroides cellulosolvens ATCC 35603 = DSM 2933 TaxID=398512 RepID=A0A0L6JK97_9FIRM|nr:N-acetylmuramoyl-L-alanine amidase [Pseudobacteroides cellulosolvens]KNY25787.1 cell wall hydrolase/autolysin [Pseudobacteroides cellulosolvens ATCC 35603 = DSM 2933]